MGKERNENQLITPKQMRELCAFFAGCVPANMTKDRAKVLIKYECVFRRLLPDILLDPFSVELQNSIKGVFVRIEAEVNLGYPIDFSIKTIEEQKVFWMNMFPKLDASHVLELAGGVLPEGAEGWGIIPKPSKIGNDYMDALKKILKLLRRNQGLNSEKIINDHEVWLEEDFKKIIEKLEAKTIGDYLVIAFQFGLRHRDEDNEDNFIANEFGFGPYEVAALLLSHPGRIVKNSHQLNIGCLGCKCIQRSGDYNHNRPHKRLCFKMIKGEKFVLESQFNNSDSEGVASGFMPK